MIIISGDRSKVQSLNSVECIHIMFPCASFIFHSDCPFCCYRPYFCLFAIVPVTSKLTDKTWIEFLFKSYIIINLMF